MGAMPCRLPPGQLEYTSALDVHLGLLQEMTLSPSAGPPCCLPPRVSAAIDEGCAPTEGQLPPLIE